MKFFNFIVIFGTVIIVVAFSVAIFFIKREKPKFYKYIFLFIIIGVLISINTIIIHNSPVRLSKNSSRLIQEILILLQYLMLSLFFFNILKNSVRYSKIIALYFLGVTVHISLIIILFFISTTDIKPVIASSFVTIIYCVLFIKDLLANRPNLILVKSPAFWIATGAFFHSCVSFPVFLLVPFVPKNEEYGILRSQIFSISNMSLIVFYLLIIKSYLCLAHPQNS